MSDLNQSVPTDVVEMWLAALVEDAGAKAAFVSTYEGEVLASRGHTETNILPLPTREQLMTGAKVVVTETGDKMIIAPAGNELLLVGVFTGNTREELMLAAITALTRPAPR